MAAPSANSFVDGVLIQSQNDDRVYKRVVLENQLKVLLISDPKADKAAASLNVRIGFNADPAELPGLAHFLEHMLFLGTEKYPKENEYGQYLNEHGGHSNAFTAINETNFYFEIAQEFLEGALDRFAQFFISPLFTDSCTERELNAVDSEHHQNLQKDPWRVLQVEKYLSREDHSFHKFGTGNLQTLKTNPATLKLNVREKLLEFHDRYYSSNMMTLCVLGRENLDQLESWVREKFSAVKNKNSSPPSESHQPLDSSHFMKMISIVPVKNKKLLELCWQFPGSNEHYREKPERYLGHLLGHEGPGSILSLLKKLGLGSSLSAGTFYTAENFSFFKVSIELTQAGLGQIEDVIKIVFQYILMMRRQGVQPWIFHECEKLAEIDFRFKEKAHPGSYVSRLSSSMQIYRGSEVLAGNYLFFAFNPDLISQYLAFLDPKKMRCVLLSQNLASKEFSTESWYGTQYRVDNMEAEFIKQLESLPNHPDLFLPPLNELVAENLELKPTEPEDNAAYPILIKSDHLSRVWFKKDSTFNVPKADIEILIRSPVAYSTPETAVATTFFCELLKDDLNEFSYAAELAGLKYALVNFSDGIKLSISGYNDKQSVLLQKILEKMKKFSPNENRYTILKDHLELGYKNWDFEPPHDHAVFNMTALVQEICWNDYEKLEALKEYVTFPYLQHFAKDLFSRNFFEIFFHGNLTRKDCLHMTELIETILSSKKLFDLEHYGSRSIELPAGKTFIYRQPVADPNNPNSALEIFFQTGHHDDLLKRCLTQYVEQYLREKFFSQLRTKEQLGYVVLSGIRSTRGAYGLRFLIQSNFAPDYLDHRVEEFLVSEKLALESIEDQEFQNHVQAIISRKLAKSQSLRQETERFWKEIISGSYNFDDHLREAEAIRNLTKKQILEFFVKYFVDTKSRAKAVTISESQQEPQRREAESNVKTLEAPSEIIDNLAQFKSSMSLFPFLQPSATFFHRNHVSSSSR